MSNILNISSENNKSNFGADVIVIYPDNTFVIVNKVQDIKEYQKLIDGHITQVKLTSHTCPGNMYIHKNGANNPKCNLKVNSLASAFQESCTVSNQDFICIYGNAIIFGPDSINKDEENEQSYTETQMKVLCEIRDKYSIYPIGGQQSCVEVYRSVIETVPQDIQDREVE